MFNIRIYFIVAGTVLILQNDLYYLILSKNYAKRLLGMYIKTQENKINDSI